MKARRCDCGETILSLEKFCPECGVRLAEPNYEKITQHNKDMYAIWVGAYCSKNGHEFQTVNISGDYLVNFCANCGKKLGEKNINTNIIGVEAGIKTETGAEKFVKNYFGW